MFRRGRIRSAVLVLGALSLVLAGMTVSLTAAGASVSSDQKDIAKVEAKIAADGEHAQALVSQFNDAQARVNALDLQIERDKRVVAEDQRVEAAATATARQLAVKAYVSSGGMDSQPLALFDGTSDITNALERNEYLGAVGDKFATALTALQLDVAKTRDAQAGVESAQQRASKTLNELTSAHDAATAAIASDEATLTRMNGNLRALLAATAAKQDQEREAAERALAAAAPAPRSNDTLPLPEPLVAPLPTSTTSSVPASPTPPTSLPPTSSPGGYANPLRAITALSPERIDQGVDYSGFGPIYAIGDGVVLNTVGSGWPGGTFIAYQLTDGAAKGLVVFAAEDIEPNVQVGQTVSSNTVIGQMYAGPDGIETGWADGSRLPDTMARTYRQFNGSNSTAFGYNFSQLLVTLGAPGGIPSTPPSGSVPANWPSW